MRKIYLHNKIEERRKDIPFMIFLTPANIKYWFPISKEGKPETQFAIIKKANTALLIFYASLLALAIVCFTAQLLSN